MKNNEKLNNYHFGRHVFEYFPWNSYNNLDITSLPKINKKIFSVFSSAFKGCSNYGIWFGQGDEFTTKISGEIFDGKYLTKIGNEVTIDDYKEEVSDWEDIEKIKLRWMLGTKILAEEYLEVIDIYNRYFNLLNDAIYLQTDEESEISVVNLGFLDGNNPECIIGLIEDEDVYSFIRSGNLRGNEFFNSITKYFNSNGYLTVKQLEAIKRCQYKNIRNFIKKVFLYVKTIHIPEKTINTVVSYLEGTPLLDKKLKIKKFEDFMLVYD